MSSEREGPLPALWLWSLVLSTMLAAGYWLWNESFALSPTPLQEYLTARAASLNTGFSATEEDLQKLTGDPLSMQSAAQLFATHCVVCHGAKAEGKIGPNLTDNSWLNGGSANDIYTTIVKGRKSRGMQAWGYLGPASCKQLAAYVFTLRSHPQPGRPPEGQPWTPGATP